MCSSDTAGEMPEPLMVPVTLTLSNAPGGKKRNSPESPHELPLNASPHVPSSPNTANEETSKFILNHERMTSYGSAVARDSADAGFETQMDSLPQQIPLRGSTGGLRVEDLSLSSPKSSSADSVDFLTPPPGATGLSNLGNTCFMNSALQCLSHSGPLTAYFLAGPWEKELNRDNPLGLDGKIAKAYAHLIENLWDPRPPKAHSFSPREFKYTIGTFNSMFSGYSQQDSQELLQSLLDGLHEDLNRILKKPYVEVPDMDDLSDSDKAQKSWELYSLRNDSVIVDLFQGQYKSRVECISCGKWSVKFDPYMFLSLPIPGVKETVVTVTVVPRSLHLSETNEPLRKSTKVDIIMPKASSIGDLLKKVSTMFNWPSEYVSAPIVLEVYDSKVFRFLQNHEPVSSIGKQDLVCILEPDYGDESFAMIQWEEMPSFQKGPAATLDPELLENARTNCTRLPVYLTHTYASVSSETENRLGSGLGTPFGIPFSLCLPRKVSVTIPHDIAKTLTEEQVHYEAKRLFGIYLYMHLMVNMVRYISGPLIQQKEDATLQDFIDFLIQNDLSWDNYSAGCKLTLVEKSLQEDQRDYDTFFSRGYANHHLASHTVLFPLDCSDLDESGPNLEETEPPGIPQPSEDRIVSFEFDTSAKLLVVQWDSDNAKNMLGEECVTKLPSFSSAPTTNVFSVRFLLQLY